MKLLVETSQKVEWVKSDNDSIIIEGIFSTAENKNINGRIYRKSILEREVDRLMEKVANKCLWGESAHPSCVYGETEILTKDGWKEIKDISDNEIVATLNPQTRNIEYQQIKNKIINHFSGDMIKFKGRQIDMSFTPEHRHLLFYNDVSYFATSKEIKDIPTSTIKKSYMSTKSSFSININELSFIEEYFNGDVYCIQVENGNFYIRNNKSVPFFTGNCPDVNPDKISHLIEKLEWQGNDLIGRAKVIDTPAGRIIKTLIKEGRIGVSSRGLGTVNENDNYVNEDYMMITYDFALEPSNQPSWIHAITENKEFDVPWIKPKPVETIDKQMSIDEAKTEYVKKIWQVLEKIEKSI